MAASFLSQAEMLAIADLPTGTPYVISPIRGSLFSLAALYGQMRLQGAAYTYMAHTDECIRNDVLQRVQRLRAVASRNAKVTQGRQFKAAQQPLEGL
jgi:hypothetical protein